MYTFDQIIIHYLLLLRKNGNIVLDVFLMRKFVVLEMTLFDHLKLKIIQ